MHCAEAKNAFMDECGDFLFPRGFKTSHRNKLTIRQGYCSEIFDGDRVLALPKSPDYIVFLWRTREQQNVFLRVVEVHKLEKKVLEKKESFERFWENKFGHDVSAVCANYRFILIRTGHHGNRRAESQFKLHNIKVARYYELP